MARIKIIDEHGNPFNYHLTDELKLRLSESAQRNRRSLTSEITARLERSFLPLTLANSVVDKIDENSRLLREICARLNVAE